MSLHGETTTFYGSLKITHGDIIKWFTSLEADRQREWIQEVVGEGTAAVNGYTVRPDPPKLEIEYQYLSHV